MMARWKFAADKSEQVVDVLLSPSACQGTAGTSTPRSFDTSEDSIVSTASSVSDRKCESDRWPCESDPWTSQTPILTTTCSATTGTCNLSGYQASIPQDGVVDYTDVSTNNEQTLMSTVARQPMSTAIEADQYSFQLYSSGVFTAPCDTRLDHGVWPSVTEVKRAQTTEG